MIFLQAVAYGTYEYLSRPCVDCGLYAGCFCDGLLDQGMCLASDRVPSEAWARGQSTPLCSQCDRRMGIRHFCRGVPRVTPPAADALPMLVRGG